MSTPHTSLDAAAPFSHAVWMLLYIHVPFCRRKCRYCAFYSEGVGSASSSERIALWADALLTDMRRSASELGRPAVETVFFGGGTPSLLPPNIMGRILDEAAAQFRLAGGAEVSMEANPDSVPLERAKAFLAAGVNRVSLGVQALDDALLSSIGRIHDKSAALAAYRSLREAGCRNVGMDFIWGLPGETLELWEKQLEEAAQLGPDHLSCYGLTLEEGTPLYQERETLLLPDEDTQASMYLRCGEILEQHGYRQYEISNYARPEHACRHNLGYWLGADYLGLGPGAVSTIAGRRWSQPEDLSVWLEAVRSGRSAALIEELDSISRLEETIMLRLRMAEGLPFSLYHELTGHDFLADNVALIPALEQEGLALIEDGHLRLTRKGMLISNSIIEQCFENMPALEPTAL